MADRVLPSREKWNVPHAPEYAQDIANEMSPRERRQVAVAWLEGRLVDREAIDYEAARMVLQPADEADRPYFAARAKAIIDAALEEA